MTGNGDADGMGKLAVFAGVHKFPARVKCAILSWHAVVAAVDGKDGPVSTENEKNWTAVRVASGSTRVLPVRKHFGVPAAEGLPIGHPRYIPTLDILRNHD